MKDNPKRNALQVIQPTRCPCSFSTASSRRNHGGLKSSPSREGPEAQGVRFRGKTRQMEKRRIEGDEGLNGVNGYMHGLSMVEYG